MSAIATPQTPQNGHALAYWEPRRALTLDAARRHSAFIKLARQVLIVLSLFLLALLVWYFLQAPKSAPQVDNPDEAVRMENPVYKGRTTDALPFKIMSDYAVRLINAPDEVKLTNPKLAFIRAQGAAESLVAAESGLYNSKLQALELNKAVDLKTDDGYQCATSHARVFVRDKRIEGDEKIACTGDFGKVGGHAYEINDNYREFVFKQGMTATIIPKQADAVLSSAQDGNTANRNVSFGGDDPIDVRAVKATYRNEKTLLSGQVDVRQRDGQILSDEMELIREVLAVESGTSQKYGAIQTIIANGNFKYVTPKTTVSGAKGVYERDKNIITVTGNVKYAEKSGRTASSDKMVYDLTTDGVRLDGGDERVKIQLGQ